MEYSFVVEADGAQAPAATRMWASTEREAYAYCQAIFASVPEAMRVQVHVGGTLFCTVRRPRSVARCRIGSPGA